MRLVLPDVRNGSPRGVANATQTRAFISTSAGRTLPCVSAESACMNLPSAITYDTQDVSSTVMSDAA